MSSIPGRAGIFSSPRRPDRHWGPPSLLSRGTGVLSPAVKRPGSESNQSLVPTAKVKNVWSYISTPPYVCMTWCLIERRVQFNLFARADSIVRSVYSEAANTVSTGFSSYGQVLTLDTALRILSLSKKAEQ
jgi:hypothetical protein